MSGVTGTLVIITANLVARALEPAHAALVAEREPARIARRVGSLSSNRCVQERRPALQVAVIIVPPENARGAKSGRVVVWAAQVELPYQCAGIAGMGENLWRCNFIRCHLRHRQKVAENLCYHTCAHSLTPSYTTAVAACSLRHLPP